MAGLATADQNDIDAVWFQPNDLIAVAHLHLAWTRLVRGDLTGAEAELARAARRAEQLGFPQGPFSLAYARFVETWVRIEAGQLDRAAVLVADLTELAERYGFDVYRLWGAAQQATVSALAALGADDLDPTALAAQIATMTTVLDTWRTVGMNIYLTSFDAVLARLLTAAGQPDQARARLDTALQLAEDTGMHFYDAELLRLRAHTPHRPRRSQSRHRRRPRTSPAARARHCSNCAPPWMISSCAVSPPAPPSPTRPAESPPTARSRNWRGPRPRRSRPTRNSASSAASRSGRSLGIPDPPTPLFTWR